MNLYAKREAKDRVFHVLAEEQELLKSLPGEDMFSRLQQLLPVVERISVEDFEAGDERRPWKVRVPLPVYEASKAKAEELGTSILKVLLRAAELRLENRAKRGKR
jgi:hypothetical protein